MPARAAPGAGDQRQDLLEHLPRHRDFGHLKRNVPPMADDLGADLGQPLAQASATTAPPSAASPASA